MRYNRDDYCSVGVLRVRTEEARVRVKRRMQPHTSLVGICTADDGVPSYSAVRLG